jgi:two-component system sensor histidine kinase TctE
MYPLVDEINRLIVDLAAAHRLNQRFTADAAHQLRTPLTTLRVQLDMARRERDPERHGKALDEAVGALTRMSHLLHQLLTLAKADHADTEGRVSVDLGQIARQEVERHFDDAAARGIDLGYAGPPQPASVPGRADLLREAVSNLVENALQYGAAGRRVTVGVTANPPEIYVEDLGPGIPREELSKVRDRFYRIPGSTGDGCGLGLSIVDEIARRSNATLVLQAGSSGAGLHARLIFSAPAHDAAAST